MMMKITKTEKIWLAAVIILYVGYNLPFVPKYNDAPGLLIHAAITLIPLWVVIYVGLFRVFRIYKLRDSAEEPTGTTAINDANSLAGTIAENNAEALAGTAETKHAATGKGGTDTSDKCEAISDTARSVANKCTAIDPAQLAMGTANDPTRPTIETTTSDAARQPADTASDGQKGDMTC